ncbi:MAG TPA: hypothetical protein PLF76_08260 [Methanomassiliicoccaceae archaeon]|nr:hypothetical protein [Methanomassiliicoccaceae archaeon]
MPRRSVRALADIAHLIDAPSAILRLPSPIDIMPIPRSARKVHGLLRSHVWPAMLVHPVPGPPGCRKNYKYRHLQ